MTRRGKTLGLTAVCAAGFALGSWNWFWQQMPWAVG